MIVVLVFLSQFWVLFCCDLEESLLVLSLTQIFFGNSDDSPESTRYLD